MKKVAKNKARKSNDLTTRALRYAKYVTTQMGDTYVNQAKEWRCLEDGLIRGYADGVKAERARKRRAAKLKRA